MGHQLDFAPLKPILLVQQFSQFSIPFTVCLSSLYFYGFSNRVLWGTQSMQVIFCVYFERTLMAAGRELNFSKKTWWAFCGIHIIRELWCLTSIFQNKLLCLSHCHNLNPVSCPLHHITWRNITLCNTKKFGAKQKLLPVSVIYLGLSLPQIDYGLLWWPSWALKEHDSKGNSL